MLQLEKPSHVIYAGSHEMNLLFRHSDIAANQIHRSLHAVAKPDKLKSRHAPNAQQHIAIGLA